MINIKKPEEIAIMREGGKKLAKILKEVIKEVKPGTTTEELENLANQLISKEGGQPSFKGYCNKHNAKPFPSALCISINQEVVHCSAVPSRTLEAGDLVGIDVGMKYKGYHTDMAVSVGVGRMSKEAKKLLKVTKQALDKGIKAIKPGNTLGDVGHTIQSFVEKQGFSVVRQLAGHGVGKEVHEDPQVLNYGEPGRGVELESGMTLAIEPMVNAGKPGVVSVGDEWSIITSDNSLSAHFEHTVLVTKKGNEILTK